MSCSTDSSPEPSGTVEAMCRLGVERYDRGAYADALSAFRRALCAAPQTPAALTGIACATDALGDWPGGLRFHARAAAAEPTPGAAVNLAMSLLGVGRLAEGWCLFEQRYAPFC